MLQEKFFYLFIFWNFGLPFTFDFFYFRNADHCSSRFGCEWCIKYCNKTFRPDHEKFCGYKGKCCIVTPASTTPFAPTTTTTTSSTPIKPKKKKKSNVIAIVVSVVLVSIVLGVLLIGVCLHFRNRLNLTKENTRAGDNSSKEHPGIRTKGRPQIIELVPDVVSCWM